MMNSRTLLISALLMALTLLNTGCPFPTPSTETLDNLDALPDVDNDGFRELETPEGVDASETIAVSIVNEITRADVEAVVGSQSGINIPPGLIAGIGITVNFSITRVYEGDVEITDRGSRGLESFEIRVEAACPQRVIAVLDVNASIPFIGDISVLPPQTIDLSLGDGSAGTFACGNVISVTAMIDETTGQPDIDVSIEDQ